MLQQCLQHSSPTVFAIIMCRLQESVGLGRNVNENMLTSRVQNIKLGWRIPTSKRNMPPSWRKARQLHRHGRRRRRRVLATRLVQDARARCHLSRSMLLSLNQSLHQLVFIRQDAYICRQWLRLTRWSWMLCQRSCRAWLLKCVQKNVRKCEWSSASKRQNFWHRRRKRWC